ncbi:MAG: oxygen-independent coproporphyrinogen III oxidase [Pseudomonadota bacterium]
MGTAECLGKLGDEALLHRYNTFGPRYTSYPTAPQFEEGFGERDYRRAVAKSNQDPLPRPLSLYLHIPFCFSLCYYCGCNKIVTPDRGKGAAYLDWLYREVALRSEGIADDRLVRQIHFGGGTPNFLTVDQLEEVLEVIARHFHLGAPGHVELGIEIDPRAVNANDVSRLAAMGFNRMSFGIQDFDPEVQRAVNRQQSADQVADLVQAARTAGVDSISFDLIYGLPRQTPEGFAQTLDRVARMRPDRISLYSYAHMPQKIKSQNRIHSEDLPTPGVKLGLFMQSLERLQSAGYEYIGMDHFALPGDPLVQARASGELQRNFQGYSTHASCDLIGLGVSAISQIDNVYCQNQGNLVTYQQQLARGNLPIERGLALSEGDDIRADVIQRIMCRGKVDFQCLGETHQIDFQRYFEHELSSLESMAADGLLDFYPGGFRVTHRGRLFLRNIAMVFDAYLEGNCQTARGAPRFSATV